MDHPESLIVVRSYMSIYHTAMDCMADAGLRRCTFSELAAMWPTGELKADRKLFYNRICVITYRVDAIAKLMASDMLRTNFVARVVYFERET